MRSIPTITLHGAIALWATACGPDPLCQTKYTYVHLRQNQPLEATLSLPPFLYVTTTDLDTETEIRDRTLLDAEGSDIWGLEEELWFPAAPPIECTNTPGVVWYAFRLRFDLGTVDQRPIDEVQFPPLEFEFPADQKRFDLILWGSLQLEGYLDGNPNHIENTPVDTGTW